MQAKRRLAVFISGGGTNLQAILDACQEPEFPAQVVVVVSNVAHAFGITRAHDAKVPSLVVPHQEYANRQDHERAIIAALDPFDVQFVALAGYMRIVTPVLLDRFHDQELDLPGIINIHPADTRAYQGAHGYEFAMGELPDHPEKLSETKITVHFVDAGVDTGQIIEQASVPIEADDTIDDLRRRGLKVEHQLYPKVIRMYAEGKISNIRTKGS